MVFHGNRLEDLRDLTVGFIQKYPLGPLQPETILVQSNGMKHWLEMALADDAALGICAATSMELPSSFLWRMYRQVLGAAAVPVAMPFDKKALVWRLWRLLPLFAQEHAVSPLLNYMAHDPEARKRYQLAQQVADVFDGYQSYRADWLDDWAQGNCVLRQSAGMPQPLPAKQQWQAALWQALQVDVAQDSALTSLPTDLAPSSVGASRSAVHAQFMHCASDRQAWTPQGLPPRIVVFGISSMPFQAVQALSALGRWCQVLMMVQNPCQHYWGRDMDLQALAHPLLASWGQQGRDYLQVLENFDQPADAIAVMTKQEIFSQPKPEFAGTRLQCIQSDILDLKVLPETPEDVADDGSVQWVQSHSVQRELEILHDHLWQWFDQHKEWKPSDVMVMVPDMAEFSASVEAVFGRFPVNHPRHIPFSVADTTPRQSPMVLALELLLSLPQSRVTLAEGLSLLEVASIRKRFELDEREVRVLLHWLQDAGVRWGLNLTHRQAWGVPEGLDKADQNSWIFGLQRLLLGYAVGGGAPWQGVAPLPQVSGLSAQKVGRLAVWVQALSAAMQSLSQPQTPARWGQILTDLLDQFFDAEDESDERLLLLLKRELSQWQSLCEQARLIEPIALTVVRENWLSGVEGGGLHQRFFGGGVQFASLMPMRSIPFKCICLLGMNDGAYPRQSPPRDFDLMAEHWRAGDRSRREDDRYLFLEAILSAREKIYFSWQGRRATDNQKMPPSVLLAQLLDFLNARFAPETQAPLQPLQAFSARYFEPDSEFFTYATDWQKALQAPVSLEREKTPVMWQSPQWTLNECTRLLRQPVEVYWRSRLQVHLQGPEDALQDDEAFEINGLVKHQLGQGLLQAPELSQAHQEMVLSGQLPMGAWGQQAEKTLISNAQRVRERAAGVAHDFPETLGPQTVHVMLAMPWGPVQIEGDVTGLRKGPQACLLMYLRPGAIARGKQAEKQARLDVLLPLWSTHVLLSSAGWSVTSALVGVDGVAMLPPLDKALATTLLEDWLALYAQAWQNILPMTSLAGLAFSQAMAKPSAATNGSSADCEKAMEKAEAAFRGGFQKFGDWERSAYVQRSFDNFEDLLVQGEAVQNFSSLAERMYGELARQAVFQGGAG